MADKKINLKAIKVGLLGDGAVGKTAICNSYLGLEFKEDTLSTIGSDRTDTKIQLKNGQEIKVILWDTAGEERFRSMALKALKAVQGIVLVFDVIKKSSFENVSNWLQQIKDNLSNPRIVLFANKVDFRKDEWEVDIEEAKSFAAKMNLQFFETSAKTKQGLNEGFSFICNEIYDKLEGKEEPEKIDITKGKKNKKKGGC